ncbi:MAG: hypothetical protein AAAC48_16780 [Phyllobacterium sp.]
MWRRLGQDHPCLVALGNAANESGAAAVQTAQDALAALDPETLNALITDAHKTLREDPGRILRAWPIGGVGH